MAKVMIVSDAELNILRKYLDSDKVLVKESIAEKHKITNGYTKYDFGDRPDVVFDVVADENHYFLTYNKKQD